MKAVFFSDTHLHKGDRARTRLLEDFLRDVATGADMVFVLGDIFEFFCGFRDYTYPWYASVIGALADLVRSGTSLYYIEGNHEVNLKNIEEATGIICTDSLTVDLDGRRTFVGHGDEFTSPGLRRLIKSGFVRTTLGRCGPAFAWCAGMAVHLLLSRKHKGVNPMVKEVFRGYARRKFAEGHDAVVLAHSHMADYMEEVTGDRKCFYVNTGDLVHSSSYGEYTSETGFRLKTYCPDSR
jgi:UDP-2,3-diacylglucosamine hydrolase